MVVDSDWCMLFNSLNFLVFFPLVLLAFFTVNDTRRWLVLLAASYVFYMAWRPEYAILLLVSTVVDFYAGLLMSRISEKKKRRPILFGALFANLGMLFVFKYANFFSENLTSALAFFGTAVELPVSSLLLPVGISFYTFQTMSYSIDVYRGNGMVERNFGRFALYVAFFPQLVAGPIERAAHILPQLRKLEARFWDERVVTGACRMFWGLFKKIVIADRLGVYVDQVYAYPDIYNGATLLLATTFFYIEVYCDFSGYTDIAIGSAAILGIDLTENFKAPLFARNIREFWQRWHLTMTTWFRDYVYFPLGGSKKGLSRTLVNTLLLFLIVGLWHGARWTYVCWGLYHGLLLVGYLLYAKATASPGDPRRPFCWREIPGVVATFLALVYSNVLFRAKDMAEAWAITEKLVDLPNYGALRLFPGKYDSFSLNLSLASLAVLFLYDYFQYRWSFAGPDEQGFRRLCDSFTARMSMSAALVTAIFVFGVFNANSFIYFDF